MLYNDDVKSKRPQQKTRREKRQFRKKTIMLSFSLIIIILTSVYVMNNRYLRLEQIEITGQKTLISSDVKQVAEDYLDKKYLWLFPRSNVFLFNRNALENKLRESFPKINNINVSLDAAETIIISIGERSAHSLWCVNRIYENPFDEECYFADESGLLYARAPYFSGNVYMKIFIEPFDENQNYIGSQVRDEQSFNELFTFLDTLSSEFPLRIGRVYFDEFDDVRVQISRLNNIIYPRREVFIRYNQNESYETVLRNIGITLDFKEFKQEFNEHSQDLQSIDVRFDRRIFYTFAPIEETVIDSDLE